MLTIWMALYLAGKTAQESIRDVAESGRVVEIATPPSERVTPGNEIAPGQPPLLSFRLFETRDRNRGMNLGLVVDDAGH